MFKLPPSDNIMALITHMTPAGRHENKCAVKLCITLLQYWALTVSVTPNITIENNRN